MATLTVRSLDNRIARQLRIRAAEHGRSAEAEHREILRFVLLGERESSPRLAAATRLDAFRARTVNRGSASAASLLEQSRTPR